MAFEDIHSCSYSCHRPACIEAQRKELAGYAQEIYQAVTAIKPKHNMTFQGVICHLIHIFGEC